MRLLKFAGASGAGLLLDFCIYTALNEAGLGATLANLVSAACGVTFVFLVSAHTIFEARQHGHVLGRLFGQYVAWQVVLIATASLAVGALSDLTGGYLLGKALVTPCTFLANYAFSAWLFSPRRSGAAA